MTLALESQNALLHIASVTLRARNADGLARWYETALGLERLSADDGRVSLGLAGEALLHLDAAPTAAPEPADSAGLFHTAFLLPDRGSLGRWFLRARRLGLRLEGASDHAVSEAFYLSDPEGNGIEIYADRPRSSWRRGADGRIVMITAPMDLAGVMAAAAEDQADDGRLPSSSRIGHVHLRVGDAQLAERFYAGALGLDVTHRRPPDAVFLSAGGYHHHLAANTWASRGAGRRNEDWLGLSEIAFATQAQSHSDGAPLVDPWGHRLRFAAPA